MGGSFVTFLYVVNLHILSHKWPQISVNWHPPRAYYRKSSDSCLRVDLNPQSQQRGWSFLWVTMFAGWHAMEYLRRVSEQQISRTNCAQTVISKFPKALKLMFCLRRCVCGCSHWKGYVAESKCVVEPALGTHLHLKYVSHIKQNRPIVPVKLNNGLPLLQNKNQRP